MSPPVRADDQPPYQPVNLPACEVIALPGGLKACAYRDVADWRAVLRVDAEVTSLRALTAAQAVQLTAAQEQADALAAALAVREASTAACQRSLAVERAALVERDRLLQLERSRPRWGSKLSWAVAAVAIGAVIGVGVAVQ